MYRTELGPVGRRLFCHEGITGCPRGPVQLDVDLQDMDTVASADAQYLLSEPNMCW